MSKKVLGLDLGSNSIGWALLEADKHDKPTGLIDLGCRIFQRAVEDKNPTPKNIHRRKCRLARRVIQRRTRRKQKMLRYLIRLNLLPESLKQDPQPEIMLNKLGDPYQLRAKALDEPLSPYELGRVLLHLVQRRGFLSNKKTLLGQDMLDDPDVLATMEELGEDASDATAKDNEEETDFKKDISQVRDKIEQSGYRTLGEYLASLPAHECKRNRLHDGGLLRTDRRMYKEELDAIWQQQSQCHDMLTNESKEQIEDIVFHQRPIKLNPDRVDKCSLEKDCTRSSVARLEYQKFRYMQDINNLRYFDSNSERYISLSNTEREMLWLLFENNSHPKFPKIHEGLRLDRGTQFNLKTSVKKLNGNTTACAIREVISEWDEYSAEKQFALVEDLITIRKKSALKKRLMNHWKYNGNTAVRLCMIEFEPGHANLSSKAIKKLLPYMMEGKIYSDARIAAGYGYKTEVKIADRLGWPPETRNPIVNKALHELRRVINAVIVEHGKPDTIRIEMLRDLKMNTKRHKEHIEQENKKTQMNNEAVEEYKGFCKQHPELNLSSYPQPAIRIKYRLWKDQNECCIYSGGMICRANLFSANTEIDHILPLSRSLDDSYMNKVVCFAEENRAKGNRTPKDAFGSNPEKWNQITQALPRWGKKLLIKQKRFYMVESDLLERDFIGSQLTDTRYICREAHEYLKTLGADISFTRGIMTYWLCRHWDLNSLLGKTNKKERKDHRHHAIDAVVTACIDRGFYQTLFTTANSLQADKRTGLGMRDLLTDPPWQDLRAETESHLENMIVSHVPRRKISGKLHEDTGAGFVKGVGTVYRKKLDGKFTQFRVDKICDPAIKKQVRKHLKKHDNNPKEAFSKGVYHKDGRTPIKRVRMIQSKTNKSRLEKTKFGIRNKQGEIFRWMTYGNIHHVEVIRHKKWQPQGGFYHYDGSGLSRTRHQWS